MIGPAASVASAAGLGCLAAGLGCFLQSGQAFGRAGGLLLPTIVGLRPQRRGQGRRQFAWGGDGGLLAVPQFVFARSEGDKAARQFTREGKGEQSDAAISTGLIHENQPTVCKGTAFSWNKCQK